MRRFAITTIALLGLAAPGAALAQGTAQPPRRHRLRSRRSQPAEAGGAAAAAASRRPGGGRPAAADEDASRSLFEPAAREFLIGGRFTSVDGDAARYQRYQDQRDGLLFSNFRYSFAKPDGTWDFHARAENVGYRDQEFMGSYDRIGKLSLSGSWQQIPQFYSVDTMTPYTGSGGTLVLDDATQRAIQNGQGNLNAYVPLAPQFDLRERRDIGRFDVVATPKPNLDVTASFTTQKHSGELPWGASFGFSNDVEVALPYDSRTNDLTIGTEWTNARNMLRVAYSGSWFDNIAPTLVWDSPLRLDDASGAPGRGRMSLWPSNSAQTISFGGYTKLAHKTQVTGSFSYGLWSNDEALQPFTINSALPHDRAAPREHRRGSARLLDQPEPQLAPVDRLAVQRAGAQLHLQQPHAGHVHYGHDQLRQLGLGDAHGRSGPLRAQPDELRRRRHVDETDAVRGHGRLLAQRRTATMRGSSSRAGENVFRVSADAVGSSWLTFRTQYEYGDRTGSGLDETQLTAIGEHPEMRHYDLADRTRNRFTGTGRYRAVGRLDVQRVRRRPQGRLQQQLLRPAGFHRPHLFAGGRLPPAQRPRRGRQLQLRALRRTAALARGGFVHGPVHRSAARLDRRFDRDGALLLDLREPAADRHEYRDRGSRTTSATQRGTTSTPSRRAARYRRPISCPTCSTSCSSCISTCGTGSPAGSPRSFSYLYEPLSIYDFAFDPSVVNGIVQPSSLVMGYVYRPYTAHSVVFGILYHW